jgi:metal transporter CNNM
MSYLIVILLVVLSGLFSGLTLGLLSLDKTELERKISLGNKQAKKVYSVRKRGNLLLCTLLLGNVAVNSTLAIFLGNIASGVIAGFAATGLIVIFGEIIPQATFARYALAVGAKTAWLVKIFIFILFPICFPIAWILDRALGDEMTTIYSKRELMKIVEEHEGSKESDVDEDEKRIIKGALSYSDKTAKEIMTPRTVVYALDAETQIDDKLLSEIVRKGFTRIPVYKDRLDNIVGLLFAKDLIGLKTHVLVENLCQKSTLEVNETILLDELLNLFIKNKKHLALVRDDYDGLSGLVTLEDILEEIVNREIIDETDRVSDMQKLARKGVKKHDN